MPGHLTIYKFGNAECGIARVIRNGAQPNQAIIIQLDNTPIVPLMGITVRRDVLTVAIQIEL